VKTLKIVVLIAILAFTTTACTTCNSAGDALNSIYPKLTYASISPSPVKGLCEVVAGNNVLYFDPTSKHLLFGEMWSPQGANVTSAAKGKVMAAKYGIFKDHLQEAIRIGSGPNEVIEIIDPDCPYCRAMASTWKERTDVTRYVFFMPLKTIHPDAESHIAYILFASDQARALDEVEAGKLDGTKKTDLTPSAITRIKAHTDITSKLGLGGVPAYFINKQFVIGADRPAIQKLLNAKGVTP
jgi:thiol:disulfide interchange protein DsbC